MPPTRNLSQGGSERRYTTAMLLFVGLSYISSSSYCRKFLFVVAVILSGRPRTRPIARLSLSSMKSEVFPRSLPRETPPRPDQTPVMSEKVQHVFRRLRAWRRAYSEGMILKGWRDLQFSRRIEAKGGGVYEGKNQPHHLFFGEPLALTAPSALPLRAWPLAPPLASNGVFSFSSTVSVSSSSSSLRSSAITSRKTTR